MYMYTIKTPWEKFRGFSWKYGPARDEINTFVRAAIEEEFSMQFSIVGVLNGYRETETVNG